MDIAGLVDRWSSRQDSRQSEAFSTVASTTARLFCRLSTRESHLSDPLLIAPLTADTFGVRNMAAPSLVELEAKKSIEDLTEKDLKGKKVLVRCDGESSSHVASCFMGACAPSFGCWLCWSSGDRRFVEIRRRRQFCF